MREAVLGLRRGKGMVLDPADPDSVSAGSFFTNPILEPEFECAIEVREVPEHARLGYAGIVLVAARRRTG